MSWPMSSGSPPWPSADNRRPTSRIITGIAAVSRSEMAQHEIAAGVAQHVVDLLEAIEADNQYRHLALVSLGA